jgi:uncharacterized protein (TIGR03086 family)
MAGCRGTAHVPQDAIALLGGAIRFALGACTQVRPAELTRPTPCADWDLAALLAHLAASMADLESGLRTGSLDLDFDLDLDGPDPVRPDPVARRGDPVEEVRDQAANLLVACYVHHRGDRLVRVAGVPLAAEILACTAALEIMVHGWDVSAARGRDEEIPPGLAAPLLGLTPLLVPFRDGLFAAPVEVPAGAGPGDRLVAFLGRRPRPSAAAAG